MMDAENGQVAPEPQPNVPIEADAPDPENEPRRTDPSPEHA
jgi:hypothetical protein